MAKITREQIQEINNKCSNGWKLDVQHYLNFSEKTLLKNIEIDDKTFLQFSLGYNYNKQISLHISKFAYLENGNGLAITEGMGKNTILDETKYSKKTINNLIIITPRLTDEELLRINSETKIDKGNGLILQSEDF